MPYIKPEDRPNLNYEMVPRSVGELNYCFTVLALRYLRHNGGLTYQRINDVLGALEGAKQEFYRRMAVPYEDEKIKLNGDVYVNF